MPCLAALMRQNMAYGDRKPAKTLILYSPIGWENIIQLLEGSGYLVDYYVYSVVIYQAVDQGNTHTISFYYDSDTGMMALRIIKNS